MTLSLGALTFLTGCDITTDSAVQSRRLANPESGHGVALLEHAASLQLLLAPDSLLAIR